MSTATFTVKVTFKDEFKDIVKFAKIKEIVIEGKNPGSSLGAAMRGDERFVLISKEDRLWALKS